VVGSGDSRGCLFFLLGPWLIARLGLAGAATLSASAGVLRWDAMASTTAVPALVGVQALNGLTFALMHLAAMSIIARSTPDLCVPKILSGPIE
jgi:MFS transporter, PPP family, 3-phenylpropionic acid transporter